jgi:hypothetical protein
MADKAQPGQRVKQASASLRNTSIDVADHWNRKGPWKDAPPVHTPRNYSKVKVKNLTGGNLPRGSVVEFDGFLLTEIEQDYLWFEGKTPDTERVGWGITLKPIPDGEIDEVLCLGVCIAWVKIVDESHEYAERESGETVLRSSAKGPVKILHKPTGETPPETRECVVQLMDEGGEATEIVEVYHSSADPGEIVEANASNVHPGRIKRFSEADGMETFEDIWICFTDNFDTWAGDVLAVQNEYYGPAKPSGPFTVGVDEAADTRTLYLVTHGERHWDAFAYEDIVAGEANLVEFMEWDGVEMKFMPTGIRWDAQDFFLNTGETVEKGTKLQVKWSGPRLIITNMYCTPSDDEDVVAIVDPEE